MKDIDNKLKELDIEDFIWVVYIFIIILSWYSNHLERKYFLYNDIESKEKYRKVLILIFSIAIIVYLYFLKNSISDLKSIKDTDSYKKRNLIYLSFIGSLLIAVSGFIFLYIAYSDENLDVELAFN